MAATMGGEKKSEADLVAEAQGKQDEEIDKAIAGAFESTEERLTVDRIDLLKNILNDIVDAQKKSKEKKRAFELRAALESALKKHETVIGKIENKELEVFLKILNAEIKKDDVAAVSQDGGLEVKERTEVKSNQELEAAGLGASDLSEKLILNIDKFLEEKKRDKIRNDLGSRDKNVGDDFDVAVGTILEDPRTAEAHANRYKNSFAIRLGGYLAAAGIGMVIAAGSVAASVATAGVFPIAIAAVGGLLIVGAGLYYAKKKRDRIGDFLPSQYNQAKLSRQALITQLDGEERVEKAARLAEKYDKQNAKNKKLAKQKITDYEKKHNADYNRTCDKIDEFQTELDTINEILEPSFSMNFEQLKKECLSDDSNAYNCVLMSPPATFDKTRDKKSVYLVKNELDEDYVAHYYNGIRWCQARRNGSAVDKLLNSGKTQWYSASDIKEITSMYGCTHFKHMKAFENINKEGKFVDLADFRNHLRDRRRQINYGKYGSKEFDEELKNIKDALKDNSITDVDAFKKKYEKILPNSGNYKRIGSCKRYLIQRSKKLEERREGSLVQLKELKKKYDDSLKELQTKVSTNLDKEDRENIARRTEDSCLLESYDPLEKKKSIELTWYKKIMPYFAYWGTCIYLNVRSTAEAGTVFVDAVQEGVAQTQEKLQKDGKDPLSIKELQDVAAVAQRLEDARDQFEKRITEITTGLNLKFSESDFSNYLKIEKCYASRKTYREKIARLISGDKIKSIMLNIFYTHPSTVLSVLGKNSDVTTKNINTVLNNAKKNLSGFSEKLITLNSLQIYFTRDENENTNYKSFMLVSSEVPGEAKNQEALFEHILLIKQSIMEVNKTLLAASKVGQLDLVIVGVKGTVADLISAAKPIAAEIEKQLEKLDVAEESLQYREAYINVFSGFSTADKLDDFMKNAENNAENLAGIILILNNKKLKAFADHIKDSNLTLEDGILKEFYDLFSRDEKTLKQDEKTLKQEKFKFFQRIKAVGKNDKQLDLLQQMYQEFCEGESFDVKDLQKLDGYPIQDLKKYIKNNEHAYRSERVLIDQKRGVLEEMQKSLVLSIPEIEETLGLEPTHEFRRIAKKRGINNYGIPYNPKISLSMDYIRNLFKSTEFAFGKMKDILFDLKFPEMTISSIDFSLGEIFKVVSDKRIPGTIESAFKFLNKIKFIIPGFDLTFGSLFDTMEKDTAVLNRENQKKVVDAIAGLRTFLGGIPDPFKGMTFPDLVLEIGRMSLEIKRLSFRLTELDPRNVRDALEMKDIILRLNMLKINFNKLNVSLGSIDLKGLVRDLPDRFPCKAALSDFVVKFDPFFDGLKKMSKRFGKLELGKFPLDDFLYICNCYPEFEKFGGFGKLVVQFPAWLKEYADLDKKIKALEKEEAEGGYNPFSLLGDYRIKLGEIKINLEKFRKFNMC
ncbi:MAG TPA: hypothetical protein VGU44_00270, partial [Gammaproteobacteria bacterium]|nr:hypothetical protein [Gammaproteobacteria bacterium]